MAKRPNDEPKLLSGGNPQVPKGDGDGPVQDYIAAMPGWKRDIGHRLDSIIERSVPGVRKAVKWNSPFYGPSEHDGWFLSFHCLTKFVKVTFFRGAAPDPEPPGTSKTPDVRYLDIYEDDEQFDETLFVVGMEITGVVERVEHIAAVRANPLDDGASVATPVHARGSTPKACGT